MKRLAPSLADFAPRLLAIQESPPARMPRAVLWAVCALVAILLVWATFGRLDVIASAEGKLVPQSYQKIVQPADAGIVADILVREGDTVREGQVLMRMDTTLARADSATIDNERRGKELALRRIEAELTGQPLRRDAGDPPALFAQVNNQTMARRKAYLESIEQEMEVLGKARHDLAAAQQTQVKLTQTVPIYRRTAESFEKLQKDGFVGPLAADEKRRERIEKEQELKAQDSAVASLRSAIAATEKKIAQITTNYHSQLANERVEVEAQFHKLTQETAKVAHKATLLELKAPQAGIIKDVATHTRGTVVSPGTVLMTLVPQNEPLIAEVQVRNEDVGFVHVNQRAKVKLAAFPFQKYGLIEGTVTHVGADANEAGAGGAGGAGKSGGAPTYKALVKLDRAHLEVAGTKLQLTSGMQTVAEIHQGTRTVMEYLLSPVQKAFLEAGRER